MQASINLFQNAFSDQTLRIFANIQYPLDGPITGVGLYRRTKTAEHFSISSDLRIIEGGLVSIDVCIVNDRRAGLEFPRTGLPLVALRALAMQGSIKEVQGS